MLLAFIISLAAGILIFHESGSVVAAVIAWLLIGAFYVYSAGSEHSKRKF